MPKLTKLTVKKVMSLKPGLRHTTDTVTKLFNGEKTITLLDFLKMDMPPEDVVWIFTRPGVVSKNQRQLFLIMCAESVLENYESRYRGNECVRGCISTLWKYTHGLASVEQLNSAASAAASAAARAAATAADVRDDASATYRAYSAAASAVYSAESAYRAADSAIYSADRVVASADRAAASAVASATYSAASAAASASASAAYSAESAYSTHSAVYSAARKLQLIFMHDVLTEPISR